MQDKKILNNKKTWDLAAQNFYGNSALPVWGPFKIKGRKNLIGEIENKIFLEVCCGSGHSIKYLIKNGAKKVYAIDLSPVQLEFAKSLNKKSVKGKKVILLESSMEEKVNIEPIDTVFSIYGIGWTFDPLKTFKNIYSYLKPGGKFIWSWDHSFFSDIEYRNAKLIVTHSYHEEKEILLKDWKGGRGAYITYRKTSSWFKYLSDAGFIIKEYLEPKPEYFEEKNSDPKKYYSIYKAEKIPATIIFVCEKPI
jgi:SAM-dependent methyltransferase